MGPKIFEEGRFWLEEAELPEDNHKFDMLHKCSNTKIGIGTSDILLDVEIKNRRCHFCGKLTIPESIYTLWELSRK